MSAKQMMLQYFHDRTYLPQDPSCFEDEVRRAAELGAQYVYIGEIPKNPSEWAAHPGDPYPNWGMLLTTLFKLVVPKGLEEWLDTEYARKNFELLKKRAAILQKYNLRAALFISEPFYFPEAAYRAHPSWRGPRCDHPRRCRDMYFSPCVDEPEVRALYAEAMDTLCSQIDIGYLQIVTNDSGAGLCWTSGLYNGPNGPEACRHIPLETRLLTFLNVFRQAGERNGRSMIVDITSNIGGFKESEVAMNNVWRALLDGLIVNGYSSRGSRPVSHTAYGLYEHYRPLRRIPIPVDFLDDYDAAMRREGSAVEVVIRESDFHEYERIIDAYARQRPENAAERMALLLRVAGGIAGPDNAGLLLDAWLKINAAMQSLRSIRLDNFVMMPLISQRLINRPLVPRPSLLTDAETAYYRPFLFQATSEEQAQDLMNIQGMDFIRGFSGTRIAVLAMDEALCLLEEAVKLLSRLDPAAFGLPADRLHVFICLIRTMRHAAIYQEILDRTAPEETAAFGTAWPARGDDRLLRLNELARAEIDNAYRLHDLITGRVGEFFTIAEETDKEDIFLVTADLPAQLIRKAEIMLAHMRDADAVYESNNN